MFEKKNYGEFIQSNEKIASNILADRLRSLCSFEILVKKPDPSNKLKFNYEATEKGRALIPIMKAMKEWGNLYFPEGALQDSA
jgi:DNA-binding HxlR family transcriptional regulator